jgi:hypothetical protein
MNLIGVCGLLFGLAAIVCAIRGARQLEQQRARALSGGAPRYAVPDSAPTWVRSFLTEMPPRRAVQDLFLVCMFTTAAGLCLASWNWSALLLLGFLYPALLAWQALRWGDRNGIFPEEEPNPSVQGTAGNATPPSTDPVARRP